MGTQLFEMCAHLLLLLRAYLLLELRVQLLLLLCAPVLADGVAKRINKELNRVWDVNVWFG